MVKGKNAIPKNGARIGLMIDGLKETPRVATKLEIDQNKVVLTIPFINGHEDPYKYWFSGKVRYGDDPNREKRRYRAPRSVTFQDSAGPVALIGSRTLGSDVNLFSGIGEGVLGFDFTVLGASSSSKYEKINGLRSEIEGLGTWIGLRSLAARKEFQENRLRSVELQLESPSPVKVCQRLNAEVQANWRYGPGDSPDETTIAERMQVCTRVSRPRTWEEHLAVHYSLRDLVRVATWRELNFTSHDVLSLRDPYRTVDGTSHGERWMGVVTHRTGVREQSTRVDRSDYVFHYGDIGPKGVRRWIDLVDRYGRGMNPLIGLLDIQGASLEARIAQVGIGFEMLGFDILVSSGRSRSSVKKASYLELVEAVSSSVDRAVPFDVTGFPSNLKRVYVNTKHADRSGSTPEEIRDVYLAAIQVFRAWVATKLGMRPSRLQEALKYDRLNP